MNFFYSLWWILPYKLRQDISAAQKRNPWESEQRYYSHQQIKASPIKYNFQEKAPRNRWNHKTEFRSDRKTDGQRVPSNVCSGISKQKGKTKPNRYSNALFGRRENKTFWNWFRRQHPNRFQLTRLLGSLSTAFANIFPQFIWLQIVFNDALKWWPVCRWTHKNRITGK